MIVIADTSPFIVLHNVGEISILPDLFHEIIIPPAVVDELKLPTRPKIIRAFANALPGWIRVLQPRNVAQIGKLHRGENAALNLAMELHANLLLVDDREAYKEAIARSLNAIGTVRVLELAAGQKLLDLRLAFEKLKQTDFWISHQLLDERLQRFLQQQNKPTP